MLSLVSLAAVSCAMAGLPSAPNSLGLGYIAEDLFGLRYERAISGWFSAVILAASSGDIDFGGMQVILTGPSSRFRIRPALGACMVRGRVEDDPESPWYGFIWPSVGFEQMFSRFSATADIGMIYGDAGEEDGEVYPVLTASVMYRF
jgi:hypothetical protein